MGLKLRIARIKRMQPLSVCWGKNRKMSKVKCSKIVCAYLIAHSLLQNKYFMAMVKIGRQWLGLWRDKLFALKSLFSTHGISSVDLNRNLLVLSVAAIEDLCSKKSFQLMFHQLIIKYCPFPWTSMHIIFRKITLFLWFKSKSAWRHLYSHTISSHWISYVCKSPTVDECVYCIYALPSKIT